MCEAVFFMKNLSTDLSSYLAQRLDPDNHPHLQVFWACEPQSVLDYQAKHWPSPNEAVHNSWLGFTFSWNSTDNAGFGRVRGKILDRNIRESKGILFPLQGAVLLICDLCWTLDYDQFWISNFTMCRKHEFAYNINLHVVKCNVTMCSIILASSEMLYSSTKEQNWAKRTSNENSFDQWHVTCKDGNGGFFSIPHSMKVHIDSPIHWTFSVRPCSDAFIILRH